MYILSLLIAASMSSMYSSGAWPRKIRTACFQSLFRSTNQGIAVRFALASPVIHTKPRFVCAQAPVAGSASGTRPSGFLSSNFWISNLAASCLIRRGHRVKLSTHHLILLPASQKFTDMRFWGTFSTPRPGWPLLDLSFFQFSLSLPSAPSPPPLRRTVEPRRAAA